nr:MAG TPA: hypothetical protein [Caudoviricetes sp.]
MTDTNQYNTQGRCIIMKNILLTATALFLAPITALAVSLSDITDNPDEYVMVSSNSTSAFYVDSYSISSIRYEPPYYSMSCQAYIVSYDINTIFRFDATATYDYNHRFKSLYAYELRQHPGYSRKEILNMAINDFELNNGMTSYLGNMVFWDFDGNYLGEMSARDRDNIAYLYGDYGLDDTSCKINSAAYHVANYMFFKGYDEYFNPKFNSKNLY